MPEIKYICTPEAEARLRKMDYDALNRHLDEVCDPPAATDDYVDLIMKLLEEKGPAPNTVTEEDVRRSWEDFCEKYPEVAPERKTEGGRIARWIFRGVAIAAIFATLLCVTLAAFGGGNRSVNVTLGDGTLFLSYTGEKDTNLTSYPQASASGSFSELRQEVAKYSPYALIPTEEPWDTSLVELNSHSSSHGENVFACYEGEDGIIMFRCLFYNSDDRPKAEFQVNNGATERYTVQGFDFYLSRNCDQSVIVWVVGQAECSIWGDFTRREAREMVDSIFAE